MTKVTYHPSSQQRISGLGPESKQITFTPEDLTLVYGKKMSSKYAPEFCKW